MKAEMTDLKYIKGVGPVRATLLKDELGIRSVRDLLYTPPFRYIDRSRMYAIRELEQDMPVVQVRGHFVSFNEEGEGAGRRLNAAFTDGQRVMTVTWFRGLNFIREHIHTFVEYVLLCKPTWYRGDPQFVHPEIEKFDPDRPPQGLRGVYTLTETLRRRKFNDKTLPTIIGNVLESMPDLGETLPAEIVSRYRLMPLDEAIRTIHQPTSPQNLARARERMKFEELFYLELHILRYARRRNYSMRGQIFSTIGEYFNTFYSNVLPFQLTGAQKRVIHEIRADMNTGRQMNRLLQGDVGSGKTMVAFMSMLIALDNKCQACLMAPTEILANQHYETIREWAESIGVKVALLTGSTRTKARREIDEALMDGSLQILIGTHAVIEERVQFKNLGMAVIDEQHRFGVAQRARLWQKNEVAPHVLVMTATPIPRTLAMTVYGDLKVSVIDELPPGRKPVTTLLRYEESRSQVYRAAGAELAKGRQVYVVYPLIAENEKIDLKSLEEGYDAICRTFPNYRVAYVHGRMKPAEKDHQMGLFASGEARILVATTVIEVGVNVPNASVMIIENAERFGLSQLHQLRGRVGRGADQSYCILMSKQKIAANTRKRLNVMTETTDGFLVSEADMQMRGPGDMEGTQQSGIPLTLQHASLVTDGQILEQARDAATALLETHPEISGQAPLPSPSTLKTNPAPDANPAPPFSGVQPPNSASAPATLPVSRESLSLLAHELHYRFDNDTDWGRIS